MIKRSIEEYIREMELMRARATPQVIKTGHEEPSVLREKQRMSEQAEEIIDEIEDRADEDDITDDEETADDIEDIAEEIVEETTGKEDVGMGRLIVNVTTGAGLLPVENATVVVSDTDSADGREIAAVRTDKSGKTPTLYLPAPDKEMSQAPQNGITTEPTRAQYNITVSAPGYVTAVVEGISVFDDVTAIQKVDMLTVSAADGNTAPRTINEKTIYRL